MIWLSLGQISLSPSPCNFGYIISLIISEYSELFQPRLTSLSYSWELLAVNHTKNRLTKNRIDKSDSEQK